MGSVQVSMIQRRDLGYPKRMHCYLATVHPAPVENRHSGGREWDAIGSSIGGAGAPSRFSGPVFPVRSSPVPGSNAGRS